MLKTKRKFVQDQLAHRLEMTEFAAADIWTQENKHPGITALRARVLPKARNDMINQVIHLYTPGQVATLQAVRCPPPQPDSGTHPPSNLTPRASRLTATPAQPDPQPSQ
jgi:hypothetical protein